MLQQARSMLTDRIAHRCVNLATLEIQSAHVPWQHKKSRPRQEDASKNPCYEGGAGDRERFRRAARSLVGRRQKFRQLLQEGAFALGADKPFDEFAIIEHQQCRNAHDVVSLCDIAMVVNIQFADNQVVFLLGCNFREDGRNHFARPTPFGPEVDKDGLALTIHSFIKCGTCESDDAVGHGGSLIVDSYFRTLIEVYAYEACSDSSQRSVSMAAMHPEPAAVMAWR